MVLDGLPENDQPPLNSTQNLTVSLYEGGGHVTLGAVGLDGHRPSVHENRTVLTWIHDEAQRVHGYIERRARPKEEGRFLLFTAVPGKGGAKCVGL